MAKRLLDGGFLCLDLLHACSVKGEEGRKKSLEILYEKRQTFLFNFFFLKST